MASTQYSSETIRAHFPALKRYPNLIFGDNAGGSQILQDAVDRITDYLINANAQMGSDYMISSTERVKQAAQKDAAKLFNAADPAEIVFGASSTQNLDNLARGLDDDVHPGDEIIVTGEHEANGGPWKKLAERRGAVIKQWQHRNISNENPYSVGLDARDLVGLISAKTRLVAFTACSNILGSVLPVKEIVQEIRKAADARGATKVEICVDCVAYAPHKRMDVQDWDVDYCVVSYYKVYGPHISGMYVRKSSLETSVHPVVHHFLSPSVDSNGSKLQPAGPGYESTWGTTALVPYLESLTPGGTIDDAYSMIADHDIKLAEALLKYLTAPKQRERGVRIVGSETPGPDRMPTISFVLVQSADGKPPMKSGAIVGEFDKRETSSRDSGGSGDVWLGIRYGHFYAYTLISSLEPKLDPSDGVVRVSFVHYNTMEDVHAFTRTLDDILYKT